MLNLRKGLDQRWDHLDLCLDDHEFKELDWERCRRDPVHFINHWVWTSDPRLADEGKPSSIPMDLFEFQVEFIEWLLERFTGKTHGVVEKSRDMGFTWLCASFAVWLWLFRRGTVAKFGSRKQELVDKRESPDSIFEKIRFIINNLPAWMIPEGFDRRVHDKLLTIKNPHNGSSILGEAGDEMGRGGRSSLYFADEWAFVQRARKVDKGLSQNSNCIIYGSTANGIGNSFHSKVNNSAYRKFRMHWTRDPRKDQEWYNMMCLLYDAVTVAQEIDIDYTASVEGIAIPSKYVVACVNAELPNPQKVGKGIVSGLDVAKGGKDLSVFIPRNGPWIKQPQHTNLNDTTKVAMWATQLMDVWGSSDLYYDVIGIGAGVEGELNRERRKFNHSGINVGDSASNREYPDERTGTQKYANLKAELWMYVRRLCENTYRYIHEGVGSDPNEMISLPDHPQLIAELSLPLAETDSRGRVLMESKKAMSRRLEGYKSPDYADALILTYAGQFTDEPFFVGRA